MGLTAADNDGEGGGVGIGHGAQVRNIQSELLNARYGDRIPGQGTNYMELFSKIVQELSETARRCGNDIMIRQSLEIHKV